MKCMYCGCIDSKVVDSRTSEDGTSIRRRRECINCGRRFTTYETVENLPAAIGWEFSIGQKPGSGYSVENNVKIAEKTIAAYLDCLAMNEENAGIIIKVTKERTSTNMGELTATCVRGIASVDFLGEITGSVSFSDKKLTVNMDKAICAYKALTGKDLKQYGVDELIGEFG